MLMDIKIIQEDFSTWPKANGDFLIWLETSCQNSAYDYQIIDAIWVTIILVTMINKSI